MSHFGCVVFRRSRQHPRRQLETITQHPLFFPLHLNTARKFLRASPFRFPTLATIRHQYIQHVRTIEKITKTMQTALVSAGRRSASTTAATVHFLACSDALNAGLVRKSSNHRWKSLVRRETMKQSCMTELPKHKHSWLL